VANLLPLLLIAGGAAYLMTAKKKKKKKVVKAEVKAGDIVASGEIDRTSIPKVGESPLPFHWRVRASAKRAGFAGVEYVGEVGQASPRDVAAGVKIWKEIGRADNPDDAQELAIAFIESQPGYEPELEVVDSGASENWEWRIVVENGRYKGQYKWGDRPWLGAVEADAVTDAFKKTLFEKAESDFQAQAGG
jgi:hypothetical protein